ncbi:uncharacterized protein LOC127026636 [Gymnogyps californianus]|uniref:uncharacterized protein LOC127026636 n=1 Tax=Gymnogyps californianus TaxID=33616 RepID=UPI0021CA6C85|nr:uncharacterized protein LOC127026636 [Gymnogyps californianus]
MRRCRGAGLAGLAAVLLVAVGRAQVQQEPSAETTEGTGIGISCSHPNIQTGDFIHWYRQLPGRGPAFLVSGTKGSKELQDPAGRLSVAADRQSNALWLAWPRHGDAAVYYCTLVTPLGLFVALLARSGSAPGFDPVPPNHDPRKILAHHIPEHPSRLSGNEAARTVEERIKELLLPVGHTYQGKNSFREGGQALEYFVRRGYGFSVIGSVQNLPGLGLE